ncbi:MAG TPA: amino acid ABC transporter substrate-binding protein [Alphaproteobacteria bacterium]|jgi:ABC-type amino acid transport substrate-binding protein|nr:amino acid ABC transporter substrate-binding protein [Alphaproteobacteria bacterium]
MRTISLALAVALLLVHAAAAATLDRVKADGVFRLGYRTDAQPYSYSTDAGLPAGYVVDLCREVAKAAGLQVGRPDLRIEYVAVTAEDRFDALRDGRIDILCDPTSMTLSRREQVDFSLMTFVDGASVLFLADGPRSFEDLAGKKVGVRGGTTTEQALRATLATLNVSADIVAVTDHRDGLKRVMSGELAAYFADRAILAFLALGSDAPQKLRLANEYFTHETYALALPRDDGAFRLLVDRTLAQIYRSGAIAKIFANSFGSAPPSDILKALYLLNSLPD